MWRIASIWSLRLGDHGISHVLLFSILNNKHSFESQPTSLLAWFILTRKLCFRGGCGRGWCSCCAGTTRIGRLVRMCSVIITQWNNLFHGLAYGSRITPPCWILLSRTVIHFRRTMASKVLSVQVIIIGVGSF